MLQHKFEIPVLRDHVTIIKLLLSVVIQNGVVLMHYIQLYLQSTISCKSK